MLIAISGALIGGTAGYFIGKYISRFGAGCPILCNPKISTIYFAVIGILFAAGK